MVRKIAVLDTTLRDGEQAPGCSLNAAEKLEIAHQLARTGVDIIEAGFAASSPGDFKAIQQIANEVKGPIITALARSIRSDIDAVVEAVKPAERQRVHVFCGVSDIHLDKKLRKSRDAAIQMSIDAIKYARKFCDDVQFSTEDASRSDFDYLCRIIEAAIDAGATVINVPDTVGYAVPGEWYEMFTSIMNRVPNIDRTQVSVHCHNDLGLSNANALEAIRAGASQVEGCFLGVGERAGNTSLEETAVTLHVRSNYYQAKTDLVLGEISRTCDLIASKMGILIPRNKAIVGENASSHSSGVHQDGVIKDASTYEIFDPALVGKKKSGIVLTARSGRAALIFRLNTLGYSNLPKEAIDTLYEKFLTIADRKKEVFDNDLRALMNDQTKVVEETYVFHNLSIGRNSGGKYTAEVSISGPGFSALNSDATSESGMIDAACQAVDKLTGIKVCLLDYECHSVSRDSRALAEAIVRVSYHDTQVTGHAVSTDVVEASVMAYVQAINKIVEELSAPDYLQQAQNLP